MDQTEFLLIAAQNTGTLNVWYTDTVPYTVKGITVPVTDVQGNSVIQYLQQVEVLTVEVNEGEFLPLEIIDRVSFGTYYFFRVKEQVISNTGNEQVPGGTVFISPGIQGSNFTNSPYNVIQGTAEIQRQSDYAMQADRASETATQVGAGLPTNIESLQSGSATKAYIQDSLYSDTGWTRARYDGTPTTRLTYGGIDPALQGNTFQGSYFTRTTLDSRIFSQSEADLVYTDYLFTGIQEVPKYEVESTTMDLTEGAGIGSTLIKVKRYATSSISIGDLIQVNNLGDEVLKVTGITIGAYPSQSLTVIRSWDPIPKLLNSLPLQTTTLVKIKPVQIYKLFGNKIQPETAGKLKIKQTGGIVYIDPLGFVVGSN